MQWHDNKIVNLVSSLGVHGTVEIERRISSEKKSFTTEACVRRYQENMGGVDRGDQMRERGAGFCRKAHFKKWYKKSFFAILDFMLLNSHIAWEMASKVRKARIHSQQRCDFYACVAEELMNFRFLDEMTVEVSRSPTAVHEPELIQGHKKSCVCCM